MRCSQPVQFTITWSRPDCDVMRISSSKPVWPGIRIISPVLSATARQWCTRISFTSHSIISSTSHYAVMSVAATSQSNSNSVAVTGAAFARACSRSCRRWEFPQSRATAAHNYSRSSVSMKRLLIVVSVVRRHEFRAAISTIFGVTSSNWPRLHGILVCRSNRVVFTNTCMVANTMSW